MYCTHCGTLNEDRARYCKKCGTPLESPPKEEKTYSPDNRIQENTAAESPGRKWLLLAAGILGILLLIVPVYLFLSGRQRSGSLEFSQQYQNRIITKRQNMYQGAVLFKQPPDSIHEPIQNAVLLLLLQRQSLPHIDKFIVFFYPQIIYYSNIS